MSVSSDIEIRTVEPQPVLFIHTTTTARHVAKTFAELLPEVGRHMQEVGAARATAPYGRFYQYEPDRVEMDAGIGVAEPAAGGGRVEAGELPGGEVAVATHVGPYTTLGKTHEAIRRRLQEEGWEPSGAPWEVYVTDPGEEPDSNKWRTDVIYPIR